MARDPSAPVSVHRALANPARVRLLEVLRAEGQPLGAVELAERLGVHPNTARANLAVLVDAGLVSAAPEARTDPGRPRLAFSALPGPSERELGGHRLLASMLARALDGLPDATAQAIEAGEAWGRYLVERPAPHERPTAADAIEHAVQLLDAHGFEPRAVEHGAVVEVSMCRCPFLELARAHQQVVCAAHLGLLRGALAELGDRAEVTGFHPFVEPSRCVVELGPRDD